MYRQPRYPGLFCFTPYRFQSPWNLSAEWVVAAKFLIPNPVYIYRVSLIKALYMKVKNVLLLVAAWFVIGRAEAQDSSASGYRISITGSVGHTISGFDALYRENFTELDTTLSPCYGTYINLQGTADLTDANMGMDFLVRGVQYSPTFDDRIFIGTYGTHITNITMTEPLKELRLMAGPVVRKTMSRSEIRFALHAGAGILWVPEIHWQKIDNSDSLTGIYPKRTLSRVGAGFSFAYRYNITKSLFAEANLNAYAIPYKSYTASGTSPTGAEPDPRSFRPFTKDLAAGIGVGIRL